MENFYELYAEYKQLRKRSAELQMKLKVLEERYTSAGSAPFDRDQTGGSSNKSEFAFMYVIQKDETAEEYNRVNLRKLALAEKLSSIIKARVRSARYEGGIDCQSVARLIYIDGLRVREIADKIPCAISTVYKMLRLAKKDLQERV